MAASPQKQKALQWRFDALSSTIHITTKQGKSLGYALRDVRDILETLWNYFGHGFFPLASHPERLAKGTERLGLGMVIAETLPDDLACAREAAALGAVLEACGLFEAQREGKVSGWRLTDTDFSPEALAARFNKG